MPAPKKKRATKNKASGSKPKFGTPAFFAKQKAKKKKKKGKKK